MVYTVNFNKYNMEYCVIKTYATKKQLQEKQHFFCQEIFHILCINFVKISKPSNFVKKISTKITL